VNEPLSNPLIGDLGLTRLSVYEDRVGPDGLHGGCAHVHALCEEAYFVAAGSGFVELHDVQSGLRSVPLEAGSYVQFAPGTLHRTVSTGGLRILAMMTGAGLAENGDARIYFGQSVDEDPREFERLVALPRTSGREGALSRRDASVAAYSKLLRQWTDDRRAYFEELERFVRLHQASVAARRSVFEPLLERRGAYGLTPPGLRLDELMTAAARGGALAQTAPAPLVLGMCGLLQPVQAAGPV